MTSRTMLISLYHIPAGKKIEAYLSDIKIEDDEASKALSL